MQVDIDRIIWIFMWIAAAIGFLFFLIGLFVRSVGADASITGLLTTVVSLGLIEMKLKLFKKEVESIKEEKDEKTEG